MPDPTPAVIPFRPPPILTYSEAVVREREALERFFKTLFLPSELVGEPGGYNYVAARAALAAFVRDVTRKPPTEEQR